jgi:PAS domain S-box-containing protein
VSIPLGNLVSRGHAERDDGMRDHRGANCDTLPHGNHQIELRRLAAIVASSADAIIGTTLDGTITSWNRAAEVIFGYHAGDVVGCSVFLLAPPDREDEMPLILDRVREGQGITHYETARRHKDGRLVEISLTVSPVRDDDGWIIGASKIARDITEDKLAEAELRYLNGTLEQRVAERTAELEEANRKLRVLIAERDLADERLQALQSNLFYTARLSAVGELAGTFAHELNQPLAAATNYVKAARRMFTSGERDKVHTVPELIDEAAGQVLRAGEIVRRLRDLVRSDETERRVESIVTIIEESSTLALAGLKPNGVQIRFRFDPNAERVLADRAQIQQVLVNLMRNSIEALAQSERRELEITTVLLDDDTVEVAVADSGPGVAKELTGRLFEPFVSTKPNGMGLGLSICRSIVRAHGGRLTSEPNSSDGTVFRFTLDAVRREDEGAEY